MIANIRELRSKTKEILMAVSRGDVVVISKHGSPCAKIIPYENAVSSAGVKEFFGLWKDRKGMGSVRAYVRRLRKSRHAR